MSTFTYFDIETTSAPETDLQQFMPEFVANRTLKDPDKIAVDLASKRKDWLDGAALSPLTGRIVAIGYISEEDIFKASFQAVGKSEKEILEEFWKLKIESKATWVGFNIFNFDLPWLVLRSIKHGVRVPRMYLLGDKWAKWDEFFDVMNLWSMGRREERISLDKLARFLGVGKKTGSGKDFASLLESDPVKAIEYLENDLKLTKACFERFIG